jgi:uncharacterized protein
MDLSAPEARVLGALVEKERTTPEHYPLTTNALVAACNQRTSRDPVTDYDDRTIDEAMRELRQRGLARTVRGSGMRSYKHRHVVDEALGLGGGELAVLAVLALRGPQTPGELRSRTERYRGASDVDGALASLASREDPLVVNLGRSPGQSQDRWAHLLAGADAARAAAAATPAVGGGGISRPSAPGRVDELAARVEALEARLARLEAALGIDDDVAS